MATVKQATFAGIDISDLVVSWGTLEQVKELLLASAQMFTGEHTLGLDNRGNAFSPASTGSLIRGLEWYGALIEIRLDGVLVYRGRVRDLQIVNEGRLANIVSEDAMKVPAQEPFVGSGVGVNPGAALLAMARTSLGDEELDIPSFVQAGGGALAAGATIDYTFGPTANATVMSAMQGVAELCSISVFVSNGRLTARPFRPYQGSGSTLGWTIEDRHILEVGTLGHDVLNFKNQVTVYYTNSAFVTKDDEESQRANGSLGPDGVFRPLVRGRSFPFTDNVVASNRQSAEFLADLCLARSSYRRQLIDLTIGAEMNGVDLGDRFPIRSAYLGLAELPVEVIEAHRDPDRDRTALKFAELRDPAPSGASIARG